MFLSVGEQYLGALELQIERASRERLRLAAERGAQKKAQATLPVRPAAGRTHWQRGDSNDLANIGAAKGTKPCFVWKPSGAMVVGTSSCHTITG